jgi:hypothetical protein
MRKWQNNPLFRFASSLKLAVFSILTLASVLAVATVMESLYGMRGAHALVYGQLWFFGVLGMLATNVLCAALSRFPWKRHQIGFVVTHSGILILLAGSWVTMRFGVDGNLPVVQGQEDGEVILNDLQLYVSDPEAGKSQVFPLKDSATRKDGKLLEVVLPAGETLVVDSFFPRAKVARVTEASKLALGVPAVHVELFNDRFEIDEWLFASGPDAPTELNLGPAVLSLQKLWNADQVKRFNQGLMAAPVPKKSPKGFVFINFQGKQFKVDIEDGLRGWVPMASTGFSLHVDQYMPYAIVEKNKLINRSNEPVNPTVQVRVKNAKGEEEQHTLFANFPDFATLHRKSKANPQPEFGVTLRMVASQAEQGGPAGVRGKLFFAQSPDNSQLLYRIIGRENKLLSQGKITVGQEMATGWMDLKLRVKQWIPSAVSSEKPSYVEKMQGSENFPAALHVDRRMADGRSTGETFWLTEGGSSSVGVGDRMLEVGFSRNRLSLPFRIHLDKFEILNDPGTNKAASYQSNVKVSDPANPSAPSALISMNEPLQYGGYTFYQASYQMREGAAPLSVFSVNYDPGRWVKYAGSLTMVFGILIMFIMNPHYWDIILGRKRS